MMEHSSSTRQLAAIMFTDVVGYTAMMGEDEDKAIHTLEKNRAIHNQLIEQYQGRLLKEIGDGMLASFNTISEACYCALEIQRSCVKEAIPLRIGIHQGEVIYRGNDVFGDGVNIASRVEALSPAGGIYVTEAVRKNIANKKGLEIRSVGEKSLKNVKEKVKIYSVLVTNSEPGIIERGPMSQKTPFLKKYRNPILGLVGAILVITLVISLLSPDKEPASQNLALGKTIAVMPFKNLSSDPEQGYFADGIAEMIRNELAKIGDLKVTSMTSSLQYKETEKSLRDIGDELGVSYLLEGSVMKSGDQVRIIAQLIEARSDKHAWGENYDGNIVETLKLQSDVAREIAKALQVTISNAEDERLSGVTTENVSAYDLYLQALNAFRKQFERLESAENERSIHLCDQALGLDPRFADAMVLRARGLLRRARIYGMGSEWLDSARIQTEKSLSINPELVDAYAILAHIWNQYQGIEGQARDKKRQEYLETALDLDPNHEEAMETLSSIYINQGDYQKGVPMLFKTIRLDPNDENKLAYWTDIGWIYERLGEFKKAEDYYRQALEMDSTSRTSVGRLEWVLTQRGEHEEALSLAEQLYRMNPENWNSIDAVGFANYALGRYEEAEYYYNKALEMIASGYQASNWAHSLEHRLAQIYMETGREPEAKKLFEEQIQYFEEKCEQGPLEHNCSYDLAAIHAYLGQPDRSFAYLREAIKGGFLFWYPNYINVDPLFDKVRDHPTFLSIMDDFNLRLESFRDAMKIELAKDEYRWITDR
jgi:adenylate cyclase